MKITVKTIMYSVAAAAALATTTASAARPDNIANTTGTMQVKYV